MKTPPSSSSNLPETFRVRLQGQSAEPGWNPSSRRSPRGTLLKRNRRCQILLGLLLVPGLWTLPLSVQAGQLEVRETKASSELAELEGITFGPANAVDGRLGTFWSEGEEAAGLGDWIDFKFAEEVNLSRIVFYPGNFYSGEYFYRHNRIKALEVKFPSGAKERVVFPDKLEKFVFTLKTPVKTRSVRFVLKEIYPGSTFNHTQLSEVQFFDERPTSRVIPTGIEASSSLASDSDASYGPDKLVDGLLDTPWCEGNDDVGVGVQLKLSWKAPTPLRQLRILNGVAVTRDTWLKNGRPTRIRLEWDGQPAQEVELKAPFGEHDVVELGGLTADRLTLTILDAAAGLKHKDGCISELLLEALPAGSR